MTRQTIPSEDRRGDRGLMVMTQALPRLKAEPIPGGGAPPPEDVPASGDDAIGDILQNGGPPQQPDTPKPDATPAQTTPKKPAPEFF